MNTLARYWQVVYFKVDGAPDPEDKRIPVFFGYTDGHYAFLDDPNWRDVLRTRDLAEVDRAFGYAMDEFEAGRIPNMPYVVERNDVIKIVDPNLYDRDRIERTKASALAKLTPEERVALGLE